ncbi:MAG: hypothetical protein LBQ87_05930 [Candidatus Fibromonas sp.]|jgi:hypothetical protein|nr:hypothetical protein [Candidatus Fibromonas sp.]
MPKFFVKKAAPSEDGKSLVFKGKVVEGPINKGMELLISIAGQTAIPVKITDIVHFEKSKDDCKKVGLVADFEDEPDDMAMIIALRITDEEIECR